MTVKGLYRPHEFPEGYYPWLSKFDLMNVSDTKQLKTLEVENMYLKKLLVEAILE
jgi:hypothetical protein